jgi:tRNA A-37 threonylcarbamoyl transferase component Bud32
MARDIKTRVRAAGEPLPTVGDPRLGSVLAGRYQLLERLGAGGMGTVYEAEQLTTRRRVAVKMLQPGLHRIEQIRRRFEREAQAASRLDHPHIVAVMDFGIADDGLFLAMELVRGTSLGDLIDGVRLPARRALLIARQVLVALAHAHHAGVVHRDLKPDNVMIVDAGPSVADRDHVKLLDFGIAKILGDVDAEAGAAPLTQAGVAFGTPEYMSPEQALGEPVDHRADLYAFGVMLFELLAGVRPFEAPDKVALLRLQIGKEPPSLLQAAPDAMSTPLFEELLRKALAKRREDRFQSADELLAAFDRAALDFFAPPEGALPRAGTVTASVQPLPRAGATELGGPSALRRRRYRSALAAIALLSLVSIGVAWRLSGVYPGRHLLGMAWLNQAIIHVARGRGTAAFDAYEKAVQADPALAEDPQLVADVGALGSRARDMTLRARARAAAERWGFGDDIDRVESFSLDLAQAPTCATRRELVPKLRALKDKRAVAALRRALAVEGGINKCLERDAREAIEFLEALP